MHAVMKCVEIQAGDTEGLVNLGFLSVELRVAIVGVTASPSMPIIGKEYRLSIEEV